MFGGTESMAFCTLEKFPLPPLSTMIVCAFDGQEKRKNANMKWRMK